MDSPIIHWLLDLFTRRNDRGPKKANEVRAKNLAKKQTNEAKEIRIN